jgi:gliding motility-associated lipoprotein GldB
MKYFLFLICSLVFLACHQENALETEISKIEVDLEIERFDKLFAQTTESELPQLKQTYPFLFPKRIADSVWVNMLKDTLQQEILREVDKKFSDFDAVELEIRKFYQHLKYYDKVFKEPRLITVINNVDYRESIVVTDSIALIALDNYLGEDHYFYDFISVYLRKNFKPESISVNLAEAYAEKYAYQTSRKTLLDEMIYFGKLLYFKDLMLPFKSDAEKIGYTGEEIKWATANEAQVWSYLVDGELLFNTDNSLPARFITPAPFSKFYLEIDNESPGRIGQYIGWQIIKAYMEQNKDTDVFQMMHKTSQEIFDNTKYKPEK